LSKEEDRHYKLEDKKKSYKRKPHDLLEQILTTEGGSRHYKGIKRVVGKPRHLGVGVPAAQ